MKTQQIKRRGGILPSAGKAFLASLLTLTLVFTTIFQFGSLWSGEEQNTANAAVYPPSSTVDYIDAKFEGITSSDHVFDVVTLERLVKGVLGQDGKSIILLGSPKNETTKRTIKYINDAAKSFGIKKIYFFDPNLGGESGADITKLTDSALAPFYLSKGAVNAPWNQLTTFTPLASDSSNSNVAGARLKYIDEDYVSDDTYLFIYDRKAGGTEVTDSATTIVSDFLVTDKAINFDASKETAFKASVTAVFTKAGWATGSAGETFFDQYHWFKSASQTGAGVWAPDIPITTYAPSAGAFKIKNVTQPELLNVLDTPGEHYIFAVRSNCGDTRSLLPYVVESARKADKPVYIFDITGWGSLPGSPWLVFSEKEPNADQPNSGTITPSDSKYFDRWNRGWSGVNSNGVAGLAYLNAAIIERLAPYSTGTDNPYLVYHPNGDRNQPLQTTSAITFISPFLAKYKKENNNNKGVVLNSLEHQPLEWEQPYKAKNDALAGQVAGNYIDYEVNTGGINEVQAAKGRASIAEFFGFDNVHKLTNYYGPIKAEDIDTSVNKSDSGCGDENDVLNDVGGTRLLANQGTEDIDVSSYDIKISYDPAKINNDTAVSAVTTITGIAKKQLTQITLDFKQLAVDKSNVKISYGGSGKALASDKIRQENNDEKDRNKLVVELPSAINANEQFELVVPYTAGTIDYYLSQGLGAKGFFKRVDGNGIAAAGEPIGSTYWFPNNNTPADGATFAITLEYPTGYEGVGPGIRTERGPIAGTSSSRSVWKINRPTAPYQVFAAIGKYSVIGAENGATQSYGYVNYLKVSDNAEYAQKVTNGYNNYFGTVSAIPFYNYINSTIYASNANRNRDRADTYAHELPFYIKTLEEIAGPYPGESAGFVFDDVSNGQGASGGWGAIETKDRPFYTSADLTPEKTFVHEYTHQWYGDAVRIAAWEHLWLNEGFAAYVTDLYYEKTESFNTQGKWQTLYNNTDASNAWWTYAPAKIEKESDMFGGAVSCYNRGGLALGALRSYLGDDAFFAILKGWPEAKKNQAVTTQDFVSYASVSSSKDLKVWANTWLYGQKKPNAWPTLGKNPGDITTVVATSIKSAKLSAIGNKVYNGKAIRPAIAVTLAGKKLAANSDYVVTYARNVNIGKATVTVTGKGKYKDKASASFKILPKTVPVKSLKAGKKKFTLKWSKVAGGITKYQARYRLATAKTWKTSNLSAKSNSKSVAKLKKGKKYAVQIRAYKTVSKVKYYSAWSKARTVKIK